jgi:hypothetical protein
MSWYRKNPLFATGLTVCVVLALAEGALIYERWSASRQAAVRLEQRKAELQAMAELTPPPTREVATAIEADLTKAQKALASMQAELKGRGPAAERIHNAKLPAARTDAYFDLATFVEKMRELAKKNDVEVREQASRFGFAAFANEGPVQEHIEPVFRQRQIAQFLVESLLDAKPRAVLAVKRERPLTQAEREARAAALAANEPVPEVTSDEGVDYFTIAPPPVSARVPGYIDTTAFRFVFTGQTAALRNFLNRLASFELPVLVREVEVDIATPEEAAAQAVPEDPANADAGANAPSVVLSVDAPNGATPAVKPDAAKAAAVRSSSRPPVAVATPIVAKPLSKFTVTVEFVELVQPAAPAADAATPAPAPGGTVQLDARPEAAGRDLDAIKPAPRAALTGRAS